jgi:hypothetical protein
MCNSQPGSIYGGVIAQFVEYLTGDSIVHSIYPNELEIKVTTEGSIFAWYLDILLKLDTNGKLTTQLYYKRDDFNFSIVKELVAWRRRFSLNRIPLSGI